LPIVEVKIMISVSSWQLLTNIYLDAENIYLAKKNFLRFEQLVLYYNVTL